jgi:hypothetical protein
MVGNLGILSGQTPVIAGLSGFLNGQAIGNNSQQQSKGILGGSGQSLAQRLGLQLGMPDTAANKIGGIGLKTPSLRETQEAESEKEEKTDRLEVSSDEQNEIDKAINDAIANGVTQQIIVSEDGRFEASIDMRVNADGSYELDMAVRFAESRSAMMEQAQMSIGDDSEEVDPESDSDSLTYQGAYAEYQRYTSYEQSLQTRGFEANIFFEEAKTVAASAEQAYGDEIGGEYMSVAGEVAHEYNLNISIKGDDLSNFNQVAEELSQFDDSGTLSGFLESAHNILTTDSTNIGAFVEATQGLVGATQEHVSTKLTNFFSDMQEQFGSTLEDMGFEPGFIERLGEDVESDLNTFFSMTNDLLGSMFGVDPIEDQQDAETQKLDLLEEQLNVLKEERREIFDAKPQTPNTEREPIPTPRIEPSAIYTNDLTPRSENMLEAVA